MYPFRFVGKVSLVTHTNHCLCLHLFPLGGTTAVGWPPTTSFLAFASLISSLCSKKKNSSVLQLPAAQCTVNMINNDKWDLLCVWKKPWTSAPHGTNIAGNLLCVHTQDQQQTQWALQNTSHTSGNNSLSLQSCWIQVFNHSMST